MPADLVQRCREASHQGADFPTVWHALLKGDPLVAGIPRQHHEAGRSLLHVPLITGHVLVYDGDHARYTLLVV
jgi:hypothetical protein